eukprot:1540830-Prymnesium_polylepis.2
MDKTSAFGRYEPFTLSLHDNALRRRRLRLLRAAGPASRRALRLAAVRAGHHRSTLQLSGIQHV